jgi:hypothetical protein
MACPEAADGGEGKVYEHVSLSELKTEPEYKDT